MRHTGNAASRAAENVLAVPHRRAYDACEYREPDGVDMQAARRALCYGGGLTALVSGAFLLFLIARPGDATALTAGDDWGTVACDLVSLVFCVFGLWSIAHPPGAGEGPARRCSRLWVSGLISAAVLSATAGDGIAAIYQVNLGHALPSPSWVDGFYIIMGPLLFAGIAQQARQRGSPFTKPRALVDACMVIATAACFSWYFVVGPTIVESKTALLANLVDAAYPAGDLFLILCLVLLAVGQEGAATRLASLALGLGLGVELATNRAYVYLSLHGGYTAGHVLDAGWPLGYLLIGLSVWLGAVSPERPPQGERTGIAAVRGGLLPSLLVYAQLPAVVVLLAAVGRTRPAPGIETGVDVGAILVVCLAVARHVLTWFEARDGAHWIETAATTDALTGLPNRARLGEQLTRALHAGSIAGTPVALLLLDLDRFKEINDSLGHHYGDLLLQQVGTRLRETLRADDFIGRLGGDEFAAILPRTAAAGAVTVCRSLVRALQAPFVVEGKTVGLGVSIGAALAPEHGTGAVELLKHADAAMYLAKRGNSGHAVYDPLRDERSAPCLTMVAELRRGIAEGELELHYQPQADLRDRHVYGVEALVHWNHPTRGLLPPDAFIPLAERTGVILPLTTWVLDQALAQCRRWLDRGRDLEISVNVSLRNLRDPSLCQTVETLLARYRVPAERLCLELTESTVMADIELSQATLQQLCALGVRISIDAFGTGYSSLSHLARLPVSELKIDRSFAQRVAADESNATIIASTIGLGRSLGLRIVTKGVETRDAWDLLGTLDCDAAQGVFFANALSAEDLEAWMDGQGQEGTLAEELGARL